MTTAGKRPLATDAFLPSGASGFDSLNLNLTSFEPRHSSSNGYGSHPPTHPHIFPPQTSDLLPLGFSPPSGHLPPSFNRYLANKPPRNHVAQLPQSSSAPSHLDTVPNGTAALYRSISADATTAPPSSHAAPNHALVQRLAHQNALIREAWEAERNYLEANRRRAEEVYQEERVIMEEVREAWENEKAALLRENQILKERIQRLEGENATLRTIASQGLQATGVMSPLASQRGGSTDASTESGPAGPIAPVADPNSLPPGLDGAARRPHHVSSPGAGSRGTSPMGQPESSPFIPLDPRMQPQTQNARDFLKDIHESGQQNDNVPVIDISEVDPKLEGITLKATAAQRYTFGESSRPSPATSPPTTTAETSNPQRPDPAKRHSSKDQTIQVLRAEESRRLTMHAGHTPNHSLSLFPTMSVADSTGAATQEDDTAPSQSAPPEEEEDEEPPLEMKITKGKGKAEEPAHEDRLGPNEACEPQQEAPEEPEEQFETADDTKLKGPLMIKNIPAQDEIFWDQVTKKLEPISQGQDSLPTVMRTQCEEEVAAGGPSGSQHLPEGVAVGGDSHHDARSALEEGEDVAGEEGVEGVERDVPLKLKTTTNFGAPFGRA